MELRDSTVALSMNERHLLFFDWRPIVTVANSALVTLYDDPLVTEEHFYENHSYSLYYKLYVMIKDTLDNNKVLEELLKLEDYKHPQLGFVTPLPLGMHLSRPQPHDGQRKLLLTEFAFLLSGQNHSDSCFGIVIYIGAAPGTHIVSLAQTFSGYIFILIDILDFEPRLSKFLNVICLNHQVTRSSVDIIHGLYYQALSKLSKRNHRNLPFRVYFISDIRYRPSGRITDTSIHNDQMLQLELARLLNCDYYLFKFKPIKLGKTDEGYPYCPGRILIQPYTTVDSHEVRLLTKKEDLLKTAYYDHDIHRILMSIYNTSIRFRSQCSDANHNSCSCADCTFSNIIYDNINAFISKHKNDYVSYLALFNAHEPTKLGIFSLFKK
jgi:hypothetical protein